MVDAGDLVPTSVTVQETDLLILAQGDVSSQARNLILTCRSQIERYIAGHPHFTGALSPWPPTPWLRPLSKKC